MANILTNLLELFFPKLCVLCKEPLTQGEEQICLDCLCDLPLTHYDVLSDNPVIQLFADKEYIENATSLFHYEKGGKTQTLVHAFKYHGNKELAYQLGRQMALTLQSHPAYRHADAIIPIPLHKKRKRKRGYNQAEWIAKGVASVWAIPVLPDILARTTTSDSQTRKNFYDRWLNVKEVFALKDTHTLAGKHILLIDDVITSGSTLSACAETLAQIPDLRISILTLAATYH